MELKKETICENTLEIIREYYLSNTEPLLSAISDNCVWLSTENTLASGASAIKSLFKDDFVMPAYRLEEPNFRPVETGCDSQLIVLGQYALYSEGKAQLVSVVRQRSTFCYREENGQWQLYHMHMSNVWSGLLNNVAFRTSVNAQTYQYVKERLFGKTGGKYEKLVFKSDVSNQFIDINTVRYIQAMDNECVICTLNERRQVPISMKDLQPRLPKNFYRIHRSFCVNCDYVTKIERYCVALVTGEVLPVPKMRYTQIRDELTALIEKYTFY